MKGQGGLSTHYAQHIERYRQAFSFDVYVDREGTFTEDFRGVFGTALRDVSIVLRDGFDDEIRIRIERREDLTALRDALTEALEAIAADKTVSEQLS